MNTTIQLLKEESDEIKTLMNEYLIKNCKIKYVPQNMNSSVVVVGYSNYRWDELDDNGKILQSKIYKLYCHFDELMKLIISDQPKAKLSDFDKNSKTIFQYIEHSGQVWVSSTNEVLKQVNECLDNQVKLLDTIYDSAQETNIFVPDTNALLTNPNLDKWEFDEVNKFEILLLPTVLSEIDKLKIFHPNKEVRDKSQSIIKRIKEWRRRGRLTEGVTIVKNKISLRALAVEPNFENTLSWLDIENNDDRIIAAFLEAFRTNINSSVVLVTSDINLQNKAEFARVPFLEPPALNE